MPSLQPEAVLLTAAPAPLASAAMPFDIGHLPGLDLRPAADGWHGWLWLTNIALQFWLLDAPIETDATYAVMLPLDAFFELRAHAARRLWRTLTGRSPGPPSREMPAQLRRLHILRLRTLDARQAGVSYRKIAQVLLDFRGTKEDFESDPRKNQVRRLAADATRLMRGDYRHLLHYPVKLKRR